MANTDGGHGGFCYFKDEIRPTEGGMNRLIDWASEHFTDLGVMISAFATGFAEGMRK